MFWFAAIRGSVLLRLAGSAQVALLGKESKSTPVKEIATMGTNLVVASKSDTMQACMSKMLARDIRHLPVVDEDTGKVSAHSFYDKCVAFMA